MQTTLFLRKKLHAARLQLSHYLTYEAQSDGDTFYWHKKPPKNFPGVLRKVIRFMIRRTHPSSLPPSTQRICLCVDIPDCAFKKSGQAENFECPKFAFGICVPATLEVNQQQPLSIEAIGIFSGMSKQGYSRYIHAAQAQMIHRIFDDPELMDYCRSRGIQAKMPSHLTSY